MLKKTQAKRIILTNYQSPGDVCQLAYAIKALHEQHPGKYITGVETSCNEIFEGNPHVISLDKDDMRVKVIQMDYPTIHEISDGYNKLRTLLHFCPSPPRAGFAFRDPGFS